MLLGDLALTLGCSLEELLPKISAWELDFWRAYAVERPFGPAMDNWRMARLCQVIYASVGIKSKTKDFLPKFDRKDSQQSMLTKLKGVFSGRSSDSHN